MNVGTIPCASVLDKSQAYHLHLKERHDPTQGDLLAVREYASFGRSENNGLRHQP